LIHARRALISYGVALFAASALAQQPPGQGLAQLVDANERFGKKLLLQVHAGSPDKNIVVSPISVSILFAALQENSYDGQLLQEINNLFGWGAYPRLSVPARMLLAAFEEPVRPVVPPRKTIPAGARVAGAPEAAWITNTFLYRTPKDVKHPIGRRFMLNAQKYYAMKFVNTGTSFPTSADLARARKSLGPSPHVDGDNDVWISSAAHLQTAWYGNTFSMSKPSPGEFVTVAGQSKQVTMVTSELSGYPYAKTADFEAAALPCNSGYMVVVLPAPGKDVRDVERALAEHPELLDANLKPALGDVALPYFKFRYELNFRESLQAMGIKTAFRDLGPMVNIPRSHLTQILQSTDIEVNREGIRADAETVAGIVYGGITGGSNRFHLQLNRPFLFLIGEQNTNALLFLGAVMDPSQN
jgi:serine protease inhibitor